MTIPAAWTERLASFGEFARETHGDLSGRRVWMGRSRLDASASALADELEASIRQLGGDVLSERAVETCATPRGPDRDCLCNADAIVMLGATPGVSAEAIDFASGPSWLNPKALSRMDVLMPEDHQRGYMHKRLREQGAMVTPYGAAEAGDGRLAVASLNNILSIVAGAKRDEHARRNPKPTIGIVTALPLEFDAVRRVLPPGEPDTKRDRIGLRQYLRTNVPAEGGGYHGVVVITARVGNNAATATAQQLFNDFDGVETLLMVGVAAGVPDLKDGTKDVWRGDVVVSNEFGVVQYDMIKRTGSGDVRADRPRPPSPEWLDVAEAIARRLSADAPPWWATMDAVTDTDWSRPGTDLLQDQDDPAKRTPAARPHDPKRVADRPRIHFGSIGSANIVMKTAEERERVRKEYGVSAVEMEGSGIAESAWRTRSDYLIVRGVCDYANDDKDKMWQPYAALAAAAFTRSLLEAMPLRSEEG